MYTLGIVMYAAANIPVSLEQLVYTLGIVMYAAANILVS